MPKALKTCLKSNKSPYLVTMILSLSMSAPPLLRHTQWSSPLSRSPEAVWPDWQIIFQFLVTYNNKEKLAKIWSNFRLILNKLSKDCQTVNFFANVAFCQIWSHCPEVPDLDSTPPSRSLFLVQNEFKCLVRITYFRSLKRLKRATVSCRIGQ